MKIHEEVMVGNYGIARGFVEAGIDLAAAYPGTPSSEILPGIIEFKRREKVNIHTEWSTNERCALEVAFGAALNGKRSVCLMKQVGLNVAFPGLLKGRKKTVKGAFVIVSCDDPGPQSSQTEQDTRLLAVFFGIPVFDPASPAEAADIAYYAVQYSAEHKVPVIVRSTHRVSHARESIPLYPIGKRKVTLQEGIISYSPLDTGHSHKASRIEKPVTSNEQPATRPLGVVASGMSCSIAMDVLSELGLADIIPVYKVLQLSAPIIDNRLSSIQYPVSSIQHPAVDSPLSADSDMFVIASAARRFVIASPQGVAIPSNRSPRRFAPRDDSKMSNVEPPIESFEGKHRTLNVEPFSFDDLRTFVDTVDKTLVLEETDVVIEALIGDSKKVFGRRNGYVPGAGELTYDIIRDIITRVINEAKIGKAKFVPDRAIEETLKEVRIQPRPPKLCAGCPHRASFYAMRYAFPEAVFPGDIGCYTLGIAQGAVDTCLDMGAGVTIASGFHDTYAQDGALIPIIASTGDSTFFHSCLAPLYDAVRKQKRFVLVIMDNGTTAMTGMQPTPQTGITADGSYTHAMKIEDVVRGLGVEFLRILDPYDIPLMISTIKEAYNYLSHQPSADSHQPSADSHQPSADSHQPSADSSQSSADSHQPSADSHQPSADSHQSSAISRQQTAVSRQQTAVSHQSSADSHQPSADSTFPCSHCEPAEDGNVSSQGDPHLLSLRVPSSLSLRGAERRGNPNSGSSGYELSAMSHELKGPAVIIARRECILFAKEKRKDMLKQVPIERDCIGCKSCMTLFDCPAMSFDDADNKVKVDEGLCIRCGMCLFACTMGKQGKGLFRFQDTYFIKSQLKAETKIVKCET